MAGRRRPRGDGRRLLPISLPCWKWPIGDARAATVGDCCPFRCRAGNGQARAGEVEAGRNLCADHDPAGGHTMSEPTEKSLFDAPPMGEQERMVEAILFASTEPVTLAELLSRMPHGCYPAEALVTLRRRYDGRGVQLLKVGDAYAFRTAADLGYLMQKEVTEARKLSRAAIETLAIVAYHQPVTRAEIEEIRGGGGGGARRRPFLCAPPCFFLLPGAPPPPRARPKQKKGARRPAPGGAPQP